MIAQESETQPTIPFLERIRIIHKREGLLEAFVPIKDIDMEDVAVDEGHVQELADSMLEEEQKEGRETGQLLPTLIGQVPGVTIGKIIDGFHRTNAIALIGRPEVYATIRTGCTMEDIADLRIVSAATHKTVQFARLMEWAQQSWGYSPWAERVSLQQALVLRNQASSGRNLGLQSDEVEAIRELVTTKCRQWRISPGTLYQHLLTAANADPELVRDVRSRRGGASLENLTPQHLQAITQDHPLDFGAQRALADAVKAHNLTVPEARNLALQAKRGKTLDEAITLIRKPYWQAGRSPRPLSEELGDRPRVTRDYEVLAERFFESEMTIGQMTIEHAKVAGSTNISTRESGLPVGSLPTLVDTQYPDAGIQSIMLYMDMARSTVIAQLTEQLGMAEEDAHDVFEQALLRTIALIRHGRLPYRSRDDIQKWAVNCITQVIKNQERFGETPAVAQRRQQELYVGAQPDASTEREALYRKEVKSHLAALEPHRRRTFVLREYFHLPLEQIAALTKRRVADVQQDLFRARSNIKDYMFPQAISLPEE